MPDNTHPRIDIDRDKLAAFYRKWKIVEFSLFGSVLTDDFRPDSDVDVMVKLEKDAPWGLFELGDMEEELGQIMGREVDLVTRPSVERSKNYIIRKDILGSSRTFHAACSNQT